MAATRRVYELLRKRQFGRPCTSYSPPTIAQEEEFDRRRNQCSAALGGGQMCANVLANQENISADCRIMCAVWSGQWMLDEFDRLTDEWVQANVPITLLQASRGEGEPSVGNVTLSGLSDEFPFIVFEVENVIMCSNSTTLRVHVAIKARMRPADDQIATVFVVIEQVDRNDYQDEDGNVESWPPIIMDWETGNVTAAIVRFQDLSERLTRATTNLYGSLVLSGGIDFVAELRPPTTQENIEPILDGTATIRGAVAPQFVLGGFFSPSDWSTAKIVRPDGQDFYTVDLRATQIATARRDELEPFYQNRNMTEQERDRTLGFVVNTMEESKMETPGMAQVTISALPKNPDARVNLCSMRNAPAPEEGSFCAILPELLATDITQQALQMAPYDPDQYTEQTSLERLAPKMSLLKELIGDEAYLAFRENFQETARLVEDSWFGGQDIPHTLIDFVTTDDPFVEPVPGTASWTDIIASSQFGHWFRAKGKAFPRDGIFDGKFIPAMCVYCGNPTDYGAMNMNSGVGMRFNHCRRNACKRFVSAVQQKLIEAQKASPNAPITEDHARDIIQGVIDGMPEDDRVMRGDNIDGFPAGVFQGSEDGEPYFDVTQIRDRWINLYDVPAPGLQGDQEEDQE